MGAMSDSSPAPDSAQSDASSEPSNETAAERKTDQTETLGDRADSSTAASKPADEWVTGDEPITAAQKSYLDTLAREAGEEIPADLTKAQASEQIDRLQQKTGRGQG